MLNVAEKPAQSSGRDLCAAACLVFEIASLLLNCIRAQHSYGSRKGNDGRATYPWDRCFARKEHFVGEELVFLLLSCQVIQTQSLQRLMNDGDFYRASFSAVRPAAVGVARLVSIQANSDHLDGRI